MARPTIIFIGDQEMVHFFKDICFPNNGDTANYNLPEIFSYKDTTSLNHHVGTLRLQRRSYLLVFIYSANDVLNDIIRKSVDQALYIANQCTPPFPIVFVSLGMPGMSIDTEQRIEKWKHDRSRHLPQAVDQFMELVQEAARAEPICLGEKIRLDIETANRINIQHHRIVNSMNAETTRAEELRIDMTHAKQEQDGLLAELDSIQDTSRLVQQRFRRFYGTFSTIGIVLGVIVFLVTSWIIKTFLPTSAIFSIPYVGLPVVIIICLVPIIGSLLVALYFSEPCYSFCLKTPHPISTEPQVVELFGAKVSNFVCNLDDGTYSGSVSFPNLIGFVGITFYTTEALQNREKAASLRSTLNTV
ncbi:hypothetical protein HDV05_008774 [Chytridiales sp. JEL 0842]|nr:hypothetical protein HDV05_008774 [Chytridiales sp. JEL 0842]